MALGALLKPTESPLICYTVLGSLLLEHGDLALTLIRMASQRALSLGRQEVVHGQALLNCALRARSYVLGIRR